MSKTQRLLKEEEVADRLAMTVATLRKWRVFNQGPPYSKVGRSVRYDAADVEAWLASRHRGGEAVEVA